MLRSIHQIQNFGGFVLAEEEVRILVLGVLVYALQGLDKLGMLFPVLGVVACYALGGCWILMSWGFSGGRVVLIGGLVFLCVRLLVLIEIDW